MTAPAADFVYMALPGSPDATSRVTRQAFDTYWSLRGYVLAVAPSNDPQVVDSLDLQVADRLGWPGGSANRAAKDLVGAEIAARSGGGAAGYVFTQTTASASWSIAHSFGRIPAVSVYVGGQQVEADVTATSTTVNVSFPAPTAGTAVLN